MNTISNSVPSKYRDEILKIIDSEPRTPNEIAQKLEIHQNTAQSVLMELALDGIIKHKKIARVHVFWKENKKSKS